MGKTKISANDVIAAIEGSGGIKTSIARSLGVHRHTVDGYLARWETVKIAYANECERVLDIAEGVLLKSITKGDSADAKWYLTKKGKHRGYVDQRQEITGADGGAIIINWDHDDDSD